VSGGVGDEAAEAASLLIGHHAVSRQPALGSMRISEVGMKEKFTCLSTSGQEFAAWNGLCPQETFSVRRPSELPAYFSSGLLPKIDSVVLVHSGSLFMVLFNRVHRQEIDQQPFAFIFPSGSPALSGGFLDHGNWSGRTMEMTREFAQAIVTSGIGNCWPFSGLPEKPTGHVSELNPTFHAAFQHLASYVSGCLNS
jgi:hypothetical protein